MKFKHFYGWLTVCFFVVGVSGAYAANVVTLGNPTPALTTQTYVAGSTGNTLFGFSIVKASGSPDNVSIFRVHLDKDPSTLFSNVTLTRNGSNIPITYTTGGVGPWYIDITLVTSRSVPNVTPDQYLVLVDIAPAVVAANGPTIASMTEVDITYSPATTTTAAATITGPAISFSPLVLTVAQQTGGVSNALVGNDTQKALIGFNFSSTGSQTITGGVFTFSASPASLGLSNFEIVESSTASYTGAGTATAVSAVGSTITVTGATTLSSKYYFLRANVAGSAAAATFDVQLTSVTIAGGGSSTGTPINHTGITIAALAATLAQQTGGVSNTLIAGDTQKALIGFNFSSNGSQTVTGGVFTFSATPVSLGISSFELVESSTASYTGAGTATAVTAVGTTITFSGYTGISSKFYFLRANVSAGASAATFDVQLTSVTTSAGSSSGVPINHTGISIATLTATLAAISPGTAPVISATVLGAGATTQVLAGFSVASNGTQTLDVVNFNISGLTAQFSSVKLYKSTTAGSVGSSIATNSGGNFTSLGESISSSTNYYYLVVDVAGSVTSASASVTVNPTQANLTFTTGGKGTLTINRTFTFAGSALSDIVLNGGTTSSIAYDTYQAASGLTQATSASMATFKIQDGGSSHNDTDNLSTTLNSLTLTIGNFAYVRTIGIFDGTTLVAELPVSSATVAFAGPLGLSAGDDASKSFDVRATFKAVVIDNTNISVTIQAAGALGSGSIFTAADAGGATTGGSTDKISVTATKIAFGAAPVGATPNTDFSLSVSAVDALGNVDTGRTGTVTLAGSPGTLSSTDAGGLTPNLSSGQRSWIHLKFSTAQSPKTVTASYSGLTTGSINFTVTSLGVSVVLSPSTPITLNYNCDFTSLASITITESDGGDFSTGNNQAFYLQLPAGYIFDTSVTTAPTVGGGDISGATALSYIGNTIVRFNYNITGITNIDHIIISGLKAKYPGTTPASAANITVIDATAVQAGNAQSDNQNHGTLIAAASGVSVSFAIHELPGNPIVTNTAQTNFTTGSSNVELLGSPAGGTFSGNGVTFTTFSSSAGSYTGYIFSPAAVGNASSVITYSVQQAAGQHCTLVATNTFTVTTGIINNLNNSYCSNGAVSSSMSVSTAQITQDNGAGFSFYDFVYYEYATFTWKSIPAPNDIFDPKSSLFTSTIQVYGGEFIGYRVQNTLTLVVNTYPSNYQFVQINVAPTVTFTAPSNAFCIYNSSVALSGSPAPQSTGTDFFTGGTGIGTAISNSGNVWTFLPSAIGTQGSSIAVTYHYTDPSTACSGTSTQSLIVYPKPTVIPSADIKVSGTPAVDSYACLGSAPPKFVATVISGTTYNWYSDAALLNAAGPTSNTFQAPTPGTVSVVPYYATQTINGCQSDAKNLTVNATQPVTVALVSSTAICSTSSLDLTGIGASVTGGATTGTWSVSSAPVGGSFLDGSASANTVFGQAISFTPTGPQIGIGSVTLKLTSAVPAAPNACPADFKLITVAVNPVATVTPGPAITVCSGDPINLGGAVGGGASQGTWSDGGRGGSFSPTAASLSAVYSPTTGDLNTGASFLLTLLTNDPAGPCNAVPGTLLLTINPKPTVNAGVDTYICEGSSITLSNVSPLIGGSATQGTWSLTSGPGGSFTNNSSGAYLTSGFTPTASDVISGGVSLRLTTNDPDGTGPSGPCVAVSDDVVIIINKAAHVNAGSPATFCAGQIITTNGSFSGSPGVTWTYPGLGTFDDNHNPITNYNPTASETTNGAVLTFTLTTDDPDGSGSTGPCLPVFSTVNITINQQPTVDAGPAVVICGLPSGLAHLTGSSGGATSSLTWTSSGGGSFTNSGAAVTDYHITTTEEGGANLTMTLTTDDPDGPTGPCVAASDVTSVLVNPIPSAPGLPSSSSTTIVNPYTIGIPHFSYCATQTITPITAIPTDVTSTIKWYSDAGKGTQVGAGASFSFPGVSNSSPSTTSFWVSQTVAGCETITPSEVVININPLPVPNFTASKFCLGDLTAFDATTAGPYQSKISTGSIQQWSWSFNDGDVLAAPANTSGTITPNTGLSVNDHAGRTLGTADQPTHQYQLLGRYDVQLTATSDLGCSSTVKSSELPQFVNSVNQNQVRIGPTPVVGFAFNNICSGDVTQFNYTSGLPGTEPTPTAAWDFGDPASGGSNTSTNNTSPTGGPTHSYLAVGTYGAKLTLTTVLGCTNTLTKSVYILPYISSFPYTETFESGTGGWATEGLNLNLPSTSPTTATTSWQLTVPDGRVISAAYSGSKAWVTNGYTDGTGFKTYYDNERSVLNGPCVDMTKLSRPVISLKYWEDTDLGLDGNYVETSIDNGASWQPLGHVNQGLNWYDRSSITGLSPAGGVGQAVGQEGWSGRTAAWTDGRFNMDQFKTVTKLRIRFVFGSNADNSTVDSLKRGGFGLDDFSIENRNRTLLGENFTNATADVGSPASGNSFNFYNFQTAATTDELVRIEYHTGLGGKDDLYSKDMADADARSGFYGVTNSFQGFISGVSDGAFLATGGWSKTVYDLQSLITSPIDITVNTVPTPANSLNVSATISPIQDVPAGKYVIQLAVVEMVVGSNKFVLRKLLPDAAGTPLTALTKTAPPQTTDVYSWNMVNVLDPTNLAVVAFVQDLTGTKEVIQAKFLSVPMSTITGLEPSTSKYLAVYPNPVNTELRVELPEVAKAPVALRLYDQVGKAIHSSTIATGSATQVIKTQELPEGMYILHIDNGDKSPIRKKIIVLHAN